MSDQKEEPNQAPQSDGQSSSQAVKQDQERETVTIDVPKGDQSSQDAPATGFKSTFWRCKDGLMNRPIQYDIVSIVFTLLIVGGGIYGYVSKESTASLVSGIVFGILLAMATYFEGCRKNPYPMLVLLVFLGSMFAYRYSVSMKFMPSGLFTLLTAIMLARNCYLVYLKRQRTNAAAAAAS